MGEDHLMRNSVEASSARFVNPFATALVVALLLGSLAALSGCRSGGAASGEAQTSAAEEPAAAAPAKGVAPPADHRMAKVAAGMPVAQVEEIMGAPTSQKSYITGKAFVPFNYGNDSGSRVEYAYQGEGRIIFAVPRWGGSLKVVRIDYDPTEDGN
jgi:hypothetical protein